MQRASSHFPIAQNASGPLQYTVDLNDEVSSADTGALGFELAFIRATAYHAYWVLLPAILGPEVTVISL